MIDNTTIIARIPHELLGEAFIKIIENIDISLKDIQVEALEKLIIVKVNNAILHNVADVFESTPYNQHIALLAIISTNIYSKLTGAYIDPDDFSNYQQYKKIKQQHNLLHGIKSFLPILMTDGVNKTAIFIYTSKKPNAHPYLASKFF